MAFDVNMQDEGGHVIESLDCDTGPLNILLPAFTDESFLYLRFIDQYGDTTFNQMQIEYQFLPEWKRLYYRAHTDEESRLLEAVEDLARRCLDDVHIYLKFIGD